uniref:Uncharacterized protein n=1 Tax=Tanacetum cinerariifolium TaxID=118510 RepID=A0A6L2N047_TANCI|nr:hypothetical protein [Tanacetum cinerariifolium]
MATLEIPYHMTGLEDMELIKGSSCWIQGLLKIKGYEWIKGERPEGLKGNKVIQILGEMVNQREQVAKLSTHTSEPSRCFNYICYDVDDDYDYKESTIPLNDIISQEPPSNVITTSPPMLPTEDPEDFLITGNEELNTIPEKKSKEFIKSSVKDLVLIPSESEDTSESESVDDESLSDEDISEDNVKIYSNPLFEFNDEYISSNVNPFFDEVLENIESKDSYDSNLDESDLLVTPLFDAIEDECFDSGGDVDEINDFEDGYYDSEGDILYLESLLSDDTTPNLPPEVFLD